MLRDVGKGLDPKRDERKTSCTAGDEVCHGRRDVPREMSYIAGDESCRGRQDVPRETRHTVEGGSEVEGTVKQSGVRGFPLQESGRDDDEGNGGEVEGGNIDEEGNGGEEGNGNEELSGDKEGNGSEEGNGDEELNGDKEGNDERNIYEGDEGGNKEGNGLHDDIYKDDDDAVKKLAMDGNSNRKGDGG